MAITGYPESGKTIALAEFATNHPAECFWFVVPAQTSGTGDWFMLFCLALGHFLDVESLELAGLQKSLSIRAAEHPVLLIIDDAHYVDDQDTLDFLRQAAESSGGRLWLVLVGSDEPQFLAGVRGRGIACQRLPGLSAVEASSLCFALGGTLTEWQVVALCWLRDLVDGHAGMLRLRHPRIRLVQSQGDWEDFFKETQTGLGHELESVRASCLKYFRQGLDPDEFELCRRLSISWHAFSKRLAQAIWGVDHNLAMFPTVWNGCLLGVLEASPGARYALPEIYRSGLTEFSDKSEKQQWHSVAADTLLNPDGRVLDASDVCDGIAHRLLSGDHTQALREAAFFLHLAHVSGMPSLESFLLDRLTNWLSRAADNRQISPGARLLWYAARLSVLQRLARDTEAEDVANVVFDVLAQESSLDDDLAVQVGAASLLFHASTTGCPERAVFAAELISDDSLDMTEPPPIPWRPFLVLSAFLQSQQNPVSFLLSLLTEEACLQTTTDAAERLGYWQLVAHGIYYAVERDAQGDSRVAAEECVRLQEAIELAEARHEWEIAASLGSALARLQIDLLRDFDAAEATSRRMLTGVDKSDPCFQALAHHTLGDALRCRNAVDAAAQSYEAALRIWPEQLATERAESLLMLAVCRARTGAYLTAYRDAVQAAAIAGADARGAVDLQVARSLLEAASFAIHGGHLPQARRVLIHAHQILRRDFQESVEWAALAQVAWSLVNRMQPDPADPQPPAPGFTITLGRDVCGAEKMAPQAPTMMLGRLCAASGSPHRALAYFEDALAEAMEPVLQLSVATFALDPALATGQLSVSVRYALVVGLWQQPEFAVNAPPGCDVVILDHYIGRVIQLAVSRCCAPDALDHLAAAIDEVESSDNCGLPAGRVLASALFALRGAIQCGDASGLDEAFGEALSCHGRVVARNLCWYWCFRYATGRPIQEADLALWQWRLVWLSLDTAAEDETFLAGLRTQQVSWWTRLADACDSERVRAAEHSLKADDSPPTLALQRLHDVLAGWVLDSAGVRCAVREVALRLRVAERLEALDAVRDPLLLAIADAVLSPAAKLSLQELRKDVDSLIAACESRQVRSAEIAPWFEGIKRLDALIGMLEEERSSAAGFHALLAMAEHADRLSEPSAANLFIALRHTCDALGRELRLFHILCEHLTSSKVQALLQSPNVPRSLKLRLAIVHHAFKAHLAQQQLMQCLTSVNLQRKLGGPQSSVARRDAEVGASDAVQELIRTVSVLQDIEVRCLSDDNPMWGDVWTCRMERGGLRKMTGALLCRMAQDQNSITRWLQPAVADFRAAIEAARRCVEEQPKRILRAAFEEGRETARAVGDNVAIEEFERIMEEVRIMPGAEAEIRQLESSARSNPLAISEEDLARESIDPNDEEAIQISADAVMRATGYPEDRRANVADDIRKIAKTEKAKRDFCRYLEPLQNLEHTSSPATIYSRPTKYVCSCTLLGYETRIETEDIDTVFAAMQRTYCDECDKRNPGGDTDT